MDNTKMAAPHNRTCHMGNNRAVVWGVVV